MQIGLVIVGGMTFGTVLTLFVVPVVYTLLTRGRNVAPDAVPGQGHSPDASQSEPRAPASAHG
jgi:multidrug efflux pump